MAKKVIVYTMDYCPFCDRAKALLQRRKIEYQEVRLSEEDDAAWDDLEKRSGMKTMPQIFADGVLVGGYSDLAAKDAQDALESLR